MTFAGFFGDSIITGLIKYFSSSVVLLCLSYVIAIVDPLERLIEDQLSMRNGSFLYYLWEKPPLPVIMQVYMFNITNAEAFLSGVDKKLKVVEVGPYVYQEILENKNATFHENGTVSFVPVRYSIPIPERSVGDPKNDIIIAANLPLLGLSSAVSKVSSFAALALSTLAKSTSAQPILNLTVHDYLWGYQDSLVSLANTILPNYIDFPRFGLMDRLFDEGHNLVSMNLPKAVANMKKEKEVEVKKLFDHPVSAAQVADEPIDVEYGSEYDDDEDIFNGIASMSLQHPSKSDENASDVIEVRDFSIDSWNGSPGLQRWGYDKSNPDSNNRCNTLRGAFDGTMFPKHIKKNEQFKVYRKAFCRTLPILFSHSGTQYGIDAYWFKLSDNAFDDSLDDPDTSCYCSKDKTCMRKGLGNITPCYYNIPAAVSLPHFYNSDPALVNEVEGIKPIKEKHESIIVMQPKLGVPIKVHSRIQLNLVTSETKFNSNIKRFDNMVLPVFWMEIAIEKLTPQLDFILNMAFNVLPIVQNTAICLLLITGIFFLVVTLSSVFCFDISSEQSNMKFRSIKYTAVFPFLKREMAKFEEREREMIQRTESV